MGLGHDLGAGVPGSDGHDCHPLAALCVVSRLTWQRIGDVELREEVVAHEDCLGEGLDAMCLLGHPGDREAAGDRTGSQQQPVPGHRRHDVFFVALTRADVDGVIRPIGRQRMAQDQSCPVQYLA